MSDSPEKRKKVAVIGGGVAGLTAAYLLHKRLDVTLFEKNDYIGGHTNTVSVENGPDEGLAIDTGFIVYNDRNYPTFIKLLDCLGIEGAPSDMSFGVSSRTLEYSSYFPKGIFAQKRNLFRPSFLGMLQDIIRFNKWANDDFFEGRLRRVTLGQYLDQLPLKSAFRNHYLLPMTAAIWSTSPREMLEFPAETFARFFLNHGLLSLGKRPQWKTIPGGSRRYVRKILEVLEGKYQIQKPVTAITRTNDGVHVRTRSGEASQFDYVVIATHADEAFQFIDDPTDDEQRLLSPWAYSDNLAVLHTDPSYMPKRKAAWASWNYQLEEKSDDRDQVTVTYHMNRLQPLKTSKNYFVTLNPKREIPKDKILREIRYTHPCFTFDSLRTQKELAKLNGANRTYFCGSYFHYGFHEDAVKSAEAVGKAFGETL